MIFEKINRYSPDPREVVMRVDSVSRAAFVFYRIANDSNATIQVASVDVASGALNFTSSLQPAADDTHIHDVSIDSMFVYVCGSTQNKFDNFDLGLIAKVEKGTGKASLTQLGSTSFASWTSFQRMSVLPHQVEVTVKRDYKWMFLFNKTSWMVWTIDKERL